MNVLVGQQTKLADGPHTKGVGGEPQYNAMFTKEERDLLCQILDGGVLWRDSGRLGEFAEELFRKLTPGEHAGPFRATWRMKGSPHEAPVWYRVDEDEEEEH